MVQAPGAKPFVTLKMPKKRDLMRTLVQLMKTLAAKHRITIPATSVKTATDDQLKKSYAKLVKKVHPDKGGSKKDFQKLHEAYENWKKTPHQGRPARPGQDDQGDAAGDEE